MESVHRRTFLKAAATAAIGSTVNLNAAASSGADIERISVAAHKLLERYAQAVMSFGGTFQDFQRLCSEAKFSREDMLRALCNVFSLDRNTVTQSQIMTYARSQWSITAAAKQSVMQLVPGDELCVTRMPVDNSPRSAADETSNADAKLDAVLLSMLRRRRAFAELLQCAWSPRISMLSARYADACATN